MEFLPPPDLVIYLRASVPTLLALVFIPAPYGRHARRGWGPTIPSRLGWIVMESPAGWFFAWVYFLGPNALRPVPLVLSGGTALPKGFRERFEKLLGESEFPIEVSEIRLAREPLTTTARGALVAALCDS